MLIEERKKIILEKLKINSMVTLAELIDEIGASESTIRRDLQMLDKEGKLKKVHGGAVAIGDDYFKNDYKVFLRQEINKGEKNEIAKFASKIVEDGDTIYIDAGTTTEHMIDYLKNKQITVVTNGIAHAKKLVDMNIKTFILGGEIKGVTEAIVGVRAVKDLESYNFTKGFFGANGISLENGCTTPDANEAMVKTEAIKKCGKAYILADKSKFDENSFITFCKMEDVIIITDKEECEKYKTEIFKIK